MPRGMRFIEDAPEAADDPRAEQRSAVQGAPGAGPV